MQRDPYGIWETEAQCEDVIEAIGNRQRAGLLKIAAPRDTMQAYNFTVFIQYNQRRNGEQGPPTRPTTGSHKACCTCMASVEPAGALRPRVPPQVFGAMPGTGRVAPPCKAPVH